MPAIKLNMATSDDSADIAQILADPLVRQRAHLLVVPDPTAVAMLMHSVHLLTIRCDDRVVGIITLDRVNADCWELGYLLNRADWGQGIMTMAVGYLLDRLKPGTRLRAIVDDDNVASQRVLAKNGFSQVRNDGEQGTWCFKKGLR
ncbi:MAG TPA: GNAT family N-acetyltransferase [Candidatus Limosilactobacillus intestinigallinarum]|jgi:RimJ/RimL family protein N-acetyltransferase|nr:GNAT family N-acetyltransferase [Candidatus Limosilactobacillus intestinigallinarum]